MIHFGRKERLRIFYRVAPVGILPLALMWLFSWLNLNPRNPTFFDRDYSARYQAGGVLIERGISEAVAAAHDHAGLRITQAGQVFDTAIDSETGSLRDADGVYSLVWISIPNPVTEWRRSRIEAAINALRVKDLAGWVGPAGEVYRLRFKSRLILWSRVLDSQASYEIALVNETGQEAATAVYDATCGLLFELSTHTAGLGTLSFVDTDFKISRNRNWQGALALVFGLAVALHQFTRRRKKLADLPKLFILEADLVLFGVMAVWMDVFYDIWFFHYLGSVGLIVIHLALAGYVFSRFGWWGIFPLFEVFWSLAYAGGQDSLQPQFAYNPALILTWVACLLFQDFRKRFA